MGRTVCVDLSPSYRLLTTLYSQPKLITDKAGRTVVILAGRPVDNDTWDQTMAGVQAALDEVERRLRFGSNHVVPVPPGGSKENRRGEFKSVSVGVSLGGGQTVRLVHNVTLLCYLTLFSLQATYSTRRTTSES